MSKTEPWASQHEARPVASALTIQQEHLFVAKKFPSFPLIYSIIYRPVTSLYPLLLQEADPFWVDPAGPVLIGTSQVLLKSLGYMIETQEKLPITDFKGGDEGNCSDFWLLLKALIFLATVTCKYSCLLFANIPAWLLFQLVTFPATVNCLHSWPLMITKELKNHLLLQVTFRWR